MSAHWRSPTGFDVAYQTQFETIHDFDGFSPDLGLFKYPANGDVDLARQCVDLLIAASMRSNLEEHRGLDHGAYVPLHHMWKKAGVPVIPVAIPSKATPSDVFRAGEILAPLRNEGVMVIGSGGMVHNLSELIWERPRDENPEPWAQAFQTWVIQRLRDRDFPALCNFQDEAPHAKKAHPTWEHFAPLLFTAGATSTSYELVDESMTELYSGWTFANLSMACVGFGKIFRDS
jgi:4,5-DOPA dioxygenase extradiol